jgi:hypothetical protein
VLLKAKKLDGLWGKKHTHVFIALKQALTMAPVLRTPQFDSTPFIVTTDSSKHGLGEC